MFEYAFKKSSELSIKDDEIQRIKFHKQKVIFIEKNRNIPDILKLSIEFPDSQKFIYSVPVIKYWELSNDILMKKKMYPLLPLQLFNLRKKLEVASKSNNVIAMKQLLIAIKEMTESIIKEITDLFNEREILGDDMDKMLVAINTLIEYLNKSYIHDEKIEVEVEQMVKTFIDPKMIKKGIKQGIELGDLNRAKIGIKNMLNEGMNKCNIAAILEVDLELVESVSKELTNS